MSLRDDLIEAATEAMSVQSDDRENAEAALDSFLDALADRADEIANEAAGSSSHDTIAHLIAVLREDT